MASKRYIVGIHRYCYKAGEPAEILKQEVVNNRVCYKAKYLDGSIDHIPLIDEGNYKIITQKDIDNNNIPRVTK
jgi:hypothetical protein